MNWLGEKMSRIIGRRRQADLLQVRQLEGFLSRKKAALLFDAVQEIDGPGAIAEVGSWKGKSTVTLALSMRLAGRKGPVYAIDHFIGSEEHAEVLDGGSTWDDFQATIRDAGVADDVHPLSMKSVEGARWLAEHDVKLRFLFLDGAHDYESVCEDIESFLPLMLPGALIALDDARPNGPFPGIYRAYEERLKPRAEELRWGGAILLLRLHS